MAKIIFVLATIMMLMNGILAVDHIVGDDNGWSTPSSPDFYSSWAARQNIVVGDTLVFNFNTNAHTVAVVPREAFDACDAGNAEIRTVGPTEITLNETGSFFFICTIDDHCDAGLKLAINVTAFGTSPGPTSTLSPEPTSTIILGPTSTPFPGPTTTTSPGPSPSSSPGMPSQDTGSSSSLSMPFTSTLFPVSLIAFVVALLS
ncbi:Cucumber peeling cupredoxin [Bienertia sinuspersici]